MSVLGDLEDKVVVCEENLAQEVESIRHVSRFITRTSPIWYDGYIMKIFLRLPKGWSKAVENQSKETCDMDGAKLWVGPGDQIYCDVEHNPKTVEAVFQKEADE